MPSDIPEQRLADIVADCERIARYTRGRTFDDFLADEMARDAVERCLLRISEAACKLGTYLDALYPETPWRQVRGIGNILRHQYDVVDPGSLWASIEEQLPDVCESARREKARLEGRGEGPA